MTKQRNYFWNDKPDIGTYDFCHGGIWECDFYIEEVAVKYEHMTEEERQRRFKGARFAWGGCAGGIAYSDHPLKAETVGDAKKEFETWYEQRLAGKIESLKKALAAAVEEHERFLAYVKEK